MIRSRPLFNIDPHSGVGGAIPKPIKLNDAIDKIDSPIFNVHCTMMGFACGHVLPTLALPLGRMCTLDASAGALRLDGC